MTEELVLRGARVIALEPGLAYANLSKRRSERHAGDFRLIEGYGEAIPLPDASVEHIVSLRVC